MKSIRIDTDVIFDRDIEVPMQDGVRLMANVFRPAEERPCPVVMSVTPYGKDVFPDWIGMTLMRLAGVRFGRLACSNWTGFEAPDPLFWTRAGFAVMQADVRGMHKSEGHAGVLTDQDAQDYFDLIEWAARQPWSSGAVGLLGVSYLCMSQWRVAALRPPSLKAIIPWEGVTDLLREFGYQDGVRETGFVSTWWRFRMQRGRNRRFAMAENFPRERDRHPLDDDWWAGKRPRLEAIDVPALVCASWSDHGLHTRGSFEGFQRIGSPDKWLFTHGRRKWETFYSREARDLQRRFFDHYLKGEDNGWERTPRVRLEVRQARDEYVVRFEPSWPPHAFAYASLYLDAKTGQLGGQPFPGAATLRYRSTGRRGKDRAWFVHHFARDTELTGSMTLKLWVSTSEGDDLDLFVVVHKLDPAGDEVFFYGFNGFGKDAVAKGWLRVSHRETDAVRSRPGRPWHTHRRRQPLVPEEIVPVEIEILPSSTLFESGSSLAVEVLGRDAARYPAFRHRRTVNRGYHTIHTGGPFDSHLLVPRRP
jgi:putative CocE/NonD family hydrolase